MYRSYVRQERVTRGLGLGGGGGKGIRREEEWGLRGIYIS